MSAEYLNPWQIEVVNYVERVHSTTGALPTHGAIIEYLKLLRYTDVTYQDIDALIKTNELFKKSMESRGIPLTDNVLTEKQLAAASVMLNLTDRRSDEKKLRDIGVTTEEFSTWMLNGMFAEYMRQRSEQLVANSTHEAHMGLLRGVRQGNTASIKLYYELTGRYNPNEESQVNIRLLIGKVLETIQRHVRDPETLNKLAVALSQVAIEAGSPVANNNVISGAQKVRRELD